MGHTPLRHGVCSSLNNTERSEREATQKVLKLAVRDSGYYRAPRHTHDFPTPFSNQQISNQRESNLLLPASHLRVKGVLVRDSGCGPAGGTLDSSATDS